MFVAPHLVTPGTTGCPRVPKVPRVPRVPGVPWGPQGFQRCFRLTDACVKNAREPSGTPGTLGTLETHKHRKIHVASPGQLGKLDQTMKTPRNLHRSPVERIVDPPCKRPNKMWKKTTPKGRTARRSARRSGSWRLACDVIARRVKHKGSLTDGELSKSLTDHLKRSAALGDGNGNSKRSGQCEGPGGRSRGHKACCGTPFSNSTWPAHCTWGRNHALHPRAVPPPPPRTQKCPQKAAASAHTRQRKTVRNNSKNLSFFCAQNPCKKRVSGKNDKKHPFSGNGSRAA